MYKVYLKRKFANTNMTQKVVSDPASFYLHTLKAYPKIMYLISTLPGLSQVKYLLNLTTKGEDVFCPFAPITTYPKGALWRKNLDILQNVLIKNAFFHKI